VGRLVRPRLVRLRLQYIRDDLKTELSEQQLDTTVHRSLAVYNRDRLAG
jgi:hypothetical protein